MIVRVYGFDWEAYAGLVMPAFAQWLLDGDAAPLYQLYEQTRCAREERFLPSALLQARTWPRAEAFVQQLPRGMHTRREYQILCVADQFTEVSDSYVHHHPPQLLQNSDALRTLWGALIEEYCQSWFTLPGGIEALEPAAVQAKEQSTCHNEIVSLLHAAGLNELAREVNAHIPLPALHEDEAFDESAETAPGTIPPGIELGYHPTTLHLRGWLAQHSVRAMALFELLACGRRCLPFGTRVGEPYESYYGYLTPDEVWQLALCLRDLTPPTAEEAEADYARFRLLHNEPSKTFRMIDEVLPEHADALLKVVRMATQYGLGLICSIG